MRATRRSRPQRVRAHTHAAAREVRAPSLCASAGANRRPPGGAAPTGARPLARCAQAPGRVWRAGGRTDFSTARRNYRKWFNLTLCSMLIFIANWQNRSKEILLTKSHGKIRIAKRFIAHLSQHTDALTNGRTTTTETLSKWIKH